ncbi:hypothetical protein KSU1_C1019 [Candidatus Jettenia caeni]|uniref:Uncharacterized protein n=1 Tax=Candidatus Jettenia caeni TaxID=247490 RepID=I3ILM0_9BACT|nr:hypothetical protein KSU1_C1019 [Candidatus Jettenia caeni]
MNDNITIGCLLYTEFKIRCHQYNNRKLTLYGDSIFTLLLLQLREALELDFIEIFFCGLWRIMISNRLKIKKSQRVER